jgi:uncharacterized membrane protein
VPRVLILILTVVSVISAGMTTVFAADQPAYKGLGLSTPYPSQTIRAGEPVTLTVSVKNYGLPPQIVTLRVLEAAGRWRASFLAAGRTVSAVAVGPDQDIVVSLRLEPPSGTRSGTFRFRLAAEGQGTRAELPLTLTMGDVLPSRLALEVELPTLRGAATSSFRYRLTLRNDSDRDLLVNLDATLPALKSAQVTFTAVGQQVTTLPIKAGESRDIDTEVSLGQQTTPAGDYEVVVKARSGDAVAERKLTLTVTGRADLSITSAEGGRLSGRAYAGSATPMKLIIKNRGGVPARNVEMNSSEPSGWEIKFDPQRIAEIAPNGEATVTANLKPLAKAIAGDYMVTLRVNAGDVSASSDFRITVVTSRLWGLVGIAVVLAAVAVVLQAVQRYGRR